MMKLKLKLMKRINYSLLGLTLLSMALLASCKKNNPSGGTPDGLGFRAMTEQNVGNGNNSKTHGVYDEDGGKVTVNWTAKDLIKVAVEDNIETQYTFELTEGADNTSGDFYTGTPHPERSFFDESIHNYVAIYPATNRDGEANNITSANASTMVATFKLPATQDYKANSFGEKAAPMIAHSENKTLQFKNIMGGICFYLKGDAIVTKIELTTKADEALWGTCTATLHGTGTEATITDKDISTSNSADQKTTVTLDCGSGVQLTPTASMFFILLPPGTLSSGFTLEVKGLDLAGGAERVLYKHDSRGGAKTIKRNSILKTSNSVYLKAGAIQAEFSVGAAHKVYFSKGNLQYNMTSGEWSFLEHQYDVVESHLQDVGTDYEDYNIVTLFGWGTSGYNNTANDLNAICYNPYNTSIEPLDSPYDASSNKFGYGPSTDMTDQNLVGTSANYDWGVYNSISNGGNNAGQWRTLTAEEWSYVLFERASSPVNRTENARYAKAIVNSNPGVILFPDSYIHPTDVSVTQINMSDVNSDVNTFNGNDWIAMENAGCVFLPANGWRGKTIVSNMNVTPLIVGNYWSSTYSTEENAYGLTFNDQIGSSPAILQVDGIRTRYNGFGVRLVRDIPYAP